MSTAFFISQYTFKHLYKGFKNPNDFYDTPKIRTPIIFSV